jgi:mono/diheme cytochrome c family protein
MNRLVIESIEGRILAGITSFVAIMVLVGWVAINEPARMASFVDQQLGRSIERGGELFAANCATCHGANGLGQTGRAPALNNPQFFGFNYLDDIQSQIIPIERQKQEEENRITELTDEREGIVAEATSATPERQQEIATRVAEIDALLNPETLDSPAALVAQYAIELEPLYVERDTQLLALQPAIDRGYLAGINRLLLAEPVDQYALTQHIQSSSNRLLQAAWGGDLGGFIRTTLYHGRPGTSSMWGNAQMVAWGQVGGGPLRTDQVGDLVNYIINWSGNNRQWTTEDLFAVQQFMKLKMEDTGEPLGDPVVTINGESNGEINTAETLVTALTGDPARGQALYEGTTPTGTRARLGCYSCHLGGAQAPATNQTWTNVTDVRLALPEFAGWTPEKYLIHSIIQPAEYVVPPYASGVMPANFGDQLTSQDLADIIAYLRRYSEQ